MKIISIVLSVLGLISLPSEAATSNSAMKNARSTIVAIFAHPDDETWMSGTLALLAAKEAPLYVVYATSGGAGQDVSGQDLIGEALAREREKESRRALATLGLKEAPIFLRLPDSSLQETENQILLVARLNELFEALEPEVVVTFGEDGVTGHIDHRMVGTAARRAVDLSETTLAVLNIALSERRASALTAYAASLGLDLAEVYSLLPVDNFAVDIKINVKKVADKRVESFALYKTQFPPALNELWRMFVAKQHNEEFIISRWHGERSALFNGILSNTIIVHGASESE